MHDMYKSYGKKKGKGNKGEYPVDDDKYCCEQALKTLQDAEVIRSNKKLMADVRKLAREKLEAAQKAANSMKA